MATENVMKLPSREVIAKQEVGHTDIPRWLSITISLGFLALILIVPVIQTAKELSVDQRPQALEVVDLPGLAQSNDDLLALINQYEDSLEDESLLRGKLLGPAQNFLTRTLGAGNEKAYIGKEGWLFYRKDVDYLTSSGFLDQESETDPRQAILEFAGQLKSRGIQLVIVPTPLKPSIHPEKLSDRYDASAPALKNASYDRFVKGLKKEGLLVFDPTSVLMEIKAQGHDSFLPADTHWNPQGMDAAASALSLFLQKNCDLKKGQDNRYQRTALSVKHHGDIAGMLMLPPTQTLFPPTPYDISQVSTSSGELWSPQPQSEILLLGDSFSNIFSLPSMGWGRSAGYAEQLSYHLQHPIDTICQNDAGAFATRQLLSRQLKRGVDRLAGKKLVIWQFAMRELAFGDWKSIPMKLGQARASEFLAIKPGSHQRVTATVVARAFSPSPSKVTYADHIIAVQLEDIESADGQIRQGQALAYVLGMKARKLTAAASWRPGDKVQIVLRSWQDFQNQYKRVNRNDLDDDDLIFEDPIWIDLGIKGATTGAIAKQPEPTASPPEQNKREVDGALQSLCADIIGQNQDNVIVGKDGWGFLRSELRHLSVGPFWGEAAQKVSKASTASKKDPLPAIIDYNKRLQALGIQLYFMPIPAKAAVYPDKLPGSIDWKPDSKERLDHVHQAFYAKLRAQGVEVIDIMPLFLEARSKGDIQLYCRRDSHFSAEACELIAKHLGTTFETQAWLTQAKTSTFESINKELTINGDLGQLSNEEAMKTPDSLKLRVITSEGIKDENSPLLLFGDSHNLVFDIGGEMHASSAGLASQLAFELKTGVDVMGVFGSGATPSRVNIMRRAKMDDNFLKQKKVFIWCLSAREFTEGSGWSAKVPLKR